MKNVLFVHSSSELYGSDRSLLNIVKYIDKEKFKVFVLLPCDGPLVQEMRKIDNVITDVHNIAVLRRKNLTIKGGLFYLWQFIRSYSFIKSYIRHNHIDIVDTNTAVVFPAAIAAKHLKKKSVWHIREIIKSKTENRVISFIMNRYADIIIANSKATGKALQVNFAKIRVVYNSVEEHLLMNRVSHFPLKVGMAGRINRWKGQKLFIDAATLVHKQYPDVIFQIAGDVYQGEEYLKEELINYIRDKKLNETIQLLGQVDDMDNFYSGLDIFVLPSIQPEPFGLVVIEAMRAGLPVIATNHGGPVEIISEGVDGYLVDYTSAEQMANRIMELLDDKEKREYMGKKGKEKERNLYSVTIMVDKIEKILMNL